MTNVTSAAHNADRRVVSEAEAASICGISPMTMRRLRKAGTGPRYVQMGVRRLGYRLFEVEAWLEGRSSPVPA